VEKLRAIPITGWSIWTEWNSADDMPLDIPPGAFDQGFITTTLRGAQVLLTVERCMCAPQYASGYETWNERRLFIDGANVAAEDGRKTAYHGKGATTVDRLPSALEDLYRKLDGAPHINAERTVRMEAWRQSNVEEERRRQERLRAKS
jgi:hypothetical protein